jgi:TnpA family transposase
VAIGQWPTQYVARVVFSGKRGELRQRYREGQEDQRGALGLPRDAGLKMLCVLWNAFQ